jgi:hypothetical protein
MGLGLLSLANRDFVALVVGKALSQVLADGLRY